MYYSFLWLTWNLTEEYLDDHKFWATFPLELSIEVSSWIVENFLVPKTDSSYGGIQIKPKTEKSSSANAWPVKKNENWKNFCA